MRQRKEGQASRRPSSDPLVVISPPAPSSQRSSQPPTPSAFTLVQPAPSRAPGTSSSTEHTYLQPGACGIAAMPSSGHAWHNSAFTQQGHLLDSQMSCNSRAIVLELPAHSSAPSVPQAHSRYEPGYSSRSMNGHHPQSHAWGQPMPSLPDTGVNICQNSSGGCTAHSLAERRLSGAGATCSGRGQPSMSSPLRPLTNGYQSSHRSGLASPGHHQLPQQQQAWGHRGAPACVSAPAQLQRQGGPSATQWQDAALPRQQPPTQQQQREGGGLNARRESFGRQQGVTGASGSEACMTPADLHRRVHDFRERLPHLPMPPSSHAKCALASLNEHTNEHTTLHFLHWWLKEHLASNDMTHSECEGPSASPGSASGSCVPAKTWLLVPNPRPTPLVMQTLKGACA